MTLQQLSQMLDTAADPVAVFGELNAPAERSLKRRYRELAAVAHPDRNPLATAQANQVFRQLQHWYGVAQRHVMAGTYGVAVRIDINTARHRYLGHASPWVGSLCNLYPADADGAAVMLKVARQPAAADAMAAEAEALTLLDRQLAGQPIRAHFPTLVESFTLRDQDGAHKAVNVLAQIGGVATLAQIVAAYPSGIDPRDAAWMFNRLLAALAVTHDAGLLHGAVLPRHFLVRPADHNGILLDWTSSVPLGNPLRQQAADAAGIYPADLAVGETARPAADLYMAGRCLVALLGGDASAADAAGTLPRSVPRPLVNFVRACLIAARHRRPQSAWRLFSQFNELLEELYGPRTFRPFLVPAAA